MSKTYAIYYGWLTDNAKGVPNSVACDIAAAHVPLLIAHYRTGRPRSHINLSKPVMSLMRSAGTQVFAYVATRWGGAKLRTVAKNVRMCLKAGVDGIFFDEADPLVNEQNFRYYQDLSARVWDSGKAVVLNAGVAQCGEAIMRVTDTLMVEHAWCNLATSSPWTQRYESNRFMGVSSNELNAMGYTVDAQRAIQDTRKAWQAGIGWHTSTSCYIELPVWFSTYMRTMNALYSPAPDLASQHS